MILLLPTPYNTHLAPISPGLDERQRSPSRRGPAPSLQLPSSSSSCSSRRERQFSLSERACSFLGPAPPSSNPDRAWGQGKTQSAEWQSQSLEDSFYNLIDKEEPSSRFSCPTLHLPQERPPSLRPPISISPHLSMTFRAWNLPHHYPYLHPSWPTSQTASRLCRRETCWSKEDSFPSLIFEISAQVSILL